MAALPSQQLHTLLQTLEFGITSTEADAMQSALEALAALAKFDFQSKRKGTPGLSTGAAGHYAWAPTTCLPNAATSADLQRKNVMCIVCHLPEHRTHGSNGINLPASLLSTSDIFSIS